MAQTEPGHAAISADEPKAKRRPLVAEIRFGPCLSARSAGFAAHQANSDRQLVDRKPYKLRRSAVLAEWPSIAV